MRFVRRHRVLCFFVLAYALAWGAIPWNSFGAPGALVAALIVVSMTEGWAGLRQLGSRLIRWRVSWIWYAAAVAVPLLVHLAATSLNVAVGASAPTLTLLTPWYGLPLAIAIHIVSPFGGPLMEEPSFRGLAQPELQKSRSPLAATTIMAIAVTGWHAPLFFMPVFESPPIGFITTVAVTFWYAWLFNHASGSSLITLIAHGTEGGVETNNLWAAGADADRLNWTYAIVWCLVALGLLIVDRRFWSQVPQRSMTLPHVDRVDVPQPNPASRALTMASLRFSTCSLAKMLEMWLLMVFCDRLSRVAMLALESPPAISSSTSRSRRVSSAKTGSAGGALISCSVRRARPGPRIASPAAIASIARMISYALAPLST